MLPDTATAVDQQEIAQQWAAQALGFIHDEVHAARLAIARAEYTIKLARRVIDEKESFDWLWSGEAFPVDFSDPATRSAFEAAFNGFIEATGAGERWALNGLTLDHIISAIS
jgi:hypothetical protein